MSSIIRALIPLSPLISEKAVCCTVHGSKPQGPLRLQATWWIDSTSKCEKVIINTLTRFVKKKTYILRFAIEDACLNHESYSNFLIAGLTKYVPISQESAFKLNILVCKAVNREDKRSRRYRDRHFAKFERSRRYRDR